MSRPAPRDGVLEKARGKVSLEAGYSLHAWIRLASTEGNDLTDGVGAVDEDEDEGSWKEWTLAEVQTHNSTDDMWMVLYDKVYVITHYLRYHPGGIDTLLKAAGHDGTSLFDKHHQWVNGHGILGGLIRTHGTHGEPGGLINWVAGEGRSKWSTEVDYGRLR